MKYLAMEELEIKSTELKNFLQKFDKRVIIGHFTQMLEFQLNSLHEKTAKLSSPMRQLYYLAGLLVTSSQKGSEINCSNEDWDYIVTHLNSIEGEYFKLFMPSGDDDVTEEWIKHREISMPSFLAYFNQGPLNYEEQSIEWIDKLYGDLDVIINSKIGLQTSDFLHFYDNLDKWCEKNLNSFANNDVQLRDNWEEYTTLKIHFSNEIPEEIKNIGDSQLSLYNLVEDYGIKNRFKPEDLADALLPLEKVKKILSALSYKIQDTDFLYYTSAKNPLYRYPIIDLEDGLYQVFEIKQVLHAIDAYLEEVCSSTEKDKSKYAKEKGSLLESKIIDLFTSFLGKSCKVYTGYYVDGCEQDILILWKDNAFIIEAKAYDINEPFRNPDKAFKRIKQDFDRSISYAYKQTWRVSEKFYKQEPLEIKDEYGNLIDTIDTSKFQDSDFAIIVTQKSFGQIEADLSLMLELEEGSFYPWAIKYDDLEVFLLALKKLHKKPRCLVDFLTDREYLHGHVVCSDELQICGGYISEMIDSEICKSVNAISCSSDFASIFDDLYRGGLGLKNERHWKEKHNGNTFFLC